MMTTSNTATITSASSSSGSSSSSVISGRTKRYSRWLFLLLQQCLMIMLIVSVVTVEVSSSNFVIFTPANAYAVPENVQGPPPRGDAAPANTFVPASRTSTAAAAQASHVNSILHHPPDNQQPYRKGVKSLNSRPRLEIPTRELRPPFPDGLNGGRLVTLPAKDYFSSNNWNIGTLLTSDTSFLLPPRDITVWLPPQYDNSPNHVRFPVLYCHDGQNAIQDSSSWTGYSWRLAGALTRMSERKMLQTNDIHAPPIVVLLPCAEDRLAFVPRRHLEYGDISQTFAQAHADFVGITLKPLIDSMFRTMPEKEHTAAIGSSLGGQASFHLLVRHSDVFGKAACMSPAFQPSILTAVATMPASTLQDKVIYMDNGGDLNDVKVPFLDPLDHLSLNHWWNPGYWWLDSQLQPGIDAMKLALDLKGIKYEYQKFAGGRHNERAWACRIDKPLLSLYGPR